MNKLVKLPELQKTMMEMQREMERSGLIEEVVGDALDELDGDDVEEETELQVNKVVEELAGDLFKGHTDAVTILIAANVDVNQARIDGLTPVSYTHQTLPTKSIL